MVFQFHKVRLKVGKAVWWEVAKMFQFHKVRLKVGEETGKNIVQVFQFHKVRLKEYAEEIQKRIDSVSIP